MLHLRGNNKIKNYGNDKDLILQIVDWKTCDYDVQINDNPSVECVSAHLQKVTTDYRSQRHAHAARGRLDRHPAVSPR